MPHAFRNEGQPYHSVLFQAGEHLVGQVAAGDLSGQLVRRDQERGLECTERRDPLGVPGPGGHQTHFELPVGHLASHHLVPLHRVCARRAGYRLDANQASRAVLDLPGELFHLVYLDACGVGRAHP